MKIAQLRNHPFILLVLKDGAQEGYFSPDFMHKTQQQLTDMSLRIASDNLSIIYADQIKKGCEIVLGISNLGLLDLCENDTNKAKEIILSQGIVYCFRAGWAKFQQLKKISPSFFEEVNITQYAQASNDSSNDIKAMHDELLAQCYQSAKLLETYQAIANIYSANTVMLDVDEDVMLFELQKFLNSALALLLIGSEKKAFTSVSYQELVNLITLVDKEQLQEEIENTITLLSEQLPLVSRTYLKDIGLLNFDDFKGIVNQQDEINIYLQEILELPITVVNELNNDFEGGYDFHDDDEDLSFLFDK